MNISRNDPRALRALALRGHILRERDRGPKIKTVGCFVRDGIILADYGPATFSRLRRKSFIEARSGQPYRISRRGLIAVRSQLDNQGV